MAIKTLFLDVGGVLATNGWDHVIRKKVIESFGLEFASIESRHPSFFEIYEVGAITLDQYLDWVIFFEKRSFSKEEFKEKIFVESVPNPQMIDYFHKLKKDYDLKVTLVSNEGREIAQHRIQKMKLNMLADTLIFSGFVGMRKPNFNIYRLALDLSQSKPEEIIYIDDRPLLVEIGKSFGLRALHHHDFSITQKAIETLLK